MFIIIFYETFIINNIFYFNNYDSNSFLFFIILKKIGRIWK